MHPFKKLIVTVVHSLLLPAGYQKDGMIWYKDHGDILVLAALVPSPYGFRNFAFEIGVHVKPIAKPGTAFSKRGIPPAAIGWWQLMDSVRGHNDELKHALNSEVEMSDDMRSEVITRVLNSDVLPALSEFGNEETLREYIVRTNALVSVTLREWLRLPPRQNS